ncbi:hypothetical protein B0J13DRAFT_531450 [Dactylonectria estremocensis]|uniref:Uncharacterized protein n=1 Tax=Dactylonectria estremocensis TaxID=1079267 RepID=A0A9P9DPJ8_9HYPO|nr:hypothetical protein B0J13DRAFT_531450 [Dactylonectria estremocensis]
MLVKAALIPDPVNIKAILATQFGDYGKGESFHSESMDFLGDSVFTTNGAQWHAPFRAIANQGPLSGENQEVNMNGVNGKMVNICDLFFRYTLDIAIESLLGYDAQSLTRVLFIPWAFLVPSYYPNTS